MGSVATLPITTPLDMSTVIGHFAVACLLDTVSILDLKPMTHMLEKLVQETCATFLHHILMSEVTVSSQYITCQFLLAE